MAQLSTYYLVTIINKWRLLYADSRAVQCMVSDRQWMSCKTIMITQSVSALAAVKKQSRVCVALTSVPDTADGDPHRNKKHNVSMGLLLPVCVTMIHYCLWPCPSFQEASQVQSVLAGDFGKWHLEDRTKQTAMKCFNHALTSHQTQHISFQEAVHQKPEGVWVVEGAPCSCISERIGGICKVSDISTRKYKMQRRCQK